MPQLPSQLFSESFHDYRTNRIAELESEINSEDKAYLLNVSQEEYIAHLVEKYRLEPVDIDTESVGIADSREKTTEVEDPVWGRTKRNHVVYTFEMNYTGDARLLRIQPGSSMSIGRSYDFYIKPDNKISFSIEDWSGNPEQVKSDLTSVKNSLSYNVKGLNNDISVYNSQLLENATNAFTRRKAELEKYNQNLVALGIPVKKKDDIPQTFSVPVTTAQRRVEIAKPSSKTESFKPDLPDPALSQSIYEDILQTTHDVGKVMERLPKLYAERDENSLRDLFLLYLEPRYTSAGGETFNGQGKTDILIRHENSNVFIAEFKFWEGQKLFSEAIEQLFGYLTWRDSKAALIILNKNKDHSAVVSEIQSIISGHAYFVEQKETIEETWLNYILHFPGDESKLIKLAVQVFHLK